MGKPICMVKTNQMRFARRYAHRYAHTHGQTPRFCQFTYKPLFITLLLTLFSWVGGGGRGGSGVGGGAGRGGFEGMGQLAGVIVGD